MVKRIGRGGAAGAVVVIALAVCACPVVLAGDALSAKHAALLNEANFDAYLTKERKQNRPCVVMFHVSWCKVCQRAFPKFANASDQVFDRKLQMGFAHVDCTDEKTLCQRYEVKGYPSIKLFAPDKDKPPRSYKGVRNEEAFVRYAERMTQPAVGTYVNAASFENSLSKEPYAGFVGMVPGGAAGAIPAGLAAAAERWMDMHLFTAVDNIAKFLSHHGIVVPSNAVLAALSLGRQQWPGRDNTTNSTAAAAFYTGSLDDPSAVESWIEKNRFPGVWAVNENTFYEFTHGNRSCVFVAVDQDNVTDADESIIRGTEHKLRDFYLFGVLDGISWGQELREFNILKPDLPRVLITEDNFDTWIEDIESVRLPSLEGDLQAVLAGATVLRQGKDVTSKLKFYFREATRFALQVRAYARRGPMEATLAAVGLLLTLCMVLCLGWCVSMCLSTLFNDGDTSWEQFQKETQKKKE